MKVETVAPVPPKPDVVITLSWEEATMLRSILGGIGQRNEIRDKLGDPLFNKLCELGVSNYGFKVDGRYL